MYNLKKGPSLSLPSAKSTAYETNSIYFKGTIILNNLLYFVKSSASVFEFKRNFQKLTLLDV